MILSNYLVYDWETGSKDKHRTQPLQLAAVVVDSRKLEIKEGGVFNTYFKPVLDPKECERLGIDEVQQEALDVNKIKLSDLEKAPILSDGWQSFVGFSHKFNPSGKAWNGLIRAGFNISNFDNVIIDRMCKEFGPWDNKWKTQALFNPIHNFDIMTDMSRWTESLRINNTNSVSLDAIREWMGIDKENAHNGIKDTLDCAFILIKLLKLYRNFSKKVVFENSFTEENKAIAKLMEQYK